MSSKELYLVTSYIYGKKKKRKWERRGHTGAGRRLITLWAACGRVFIAYLVIRLAKRKHEEAVATVTLLLSAVWEAVDFAGFTNTFLIAAVRVTLHSEASTCTILLAAVRITFRFTFASSTIKFGGICFTKHCRAVATWTGAQTIFGARTCHAAISTWKKKMKYDWQQGCVGFTKLSF